MNEVIIISIIYGLVVLILVGLIVFRDIMFSKQLKDVAHLMKAGSLDELRKYEGKTVEDNSIFREEPNDLPINEDKPLDFSGDLKVIMDDGKERPITIIK